MKPRVRAQLHSSSARSSKIIRDHTQIETVVEVEGVGRLVLDVRKDDRAEHLNSRDAQEHEQVPPKCHPPQHIPTQQAAYAYPPLGYARHDKRR